MKKISLFLPILILALLILPACSKEKVEHEGYVLAENTGGDFDFYYPEGWEAERADAGFVQVHVSDTDFSNVSVSAINFAGRYNDLKSYVTERYFKEIQENFKDAAGVNNEDGTLRITALQIDGYDAVYFDYSAPVFTADSGVQQYAFRTYLISNGGNVYNITYTANQTEKDLFGEHLEQVKKMVEYFRFR